jgi:hypothetical protein
MFILNVNIHIQDSLMSQATSPRSVDLPSACYSIAFCVLKDLKTRIPKIAVSCHLSFSKNWISKVFSIVYMFITNK